METDVDAELLKICWVPLGFRLTNKYYAAKFHIKVFSDFDLTSNILGLFHSLMISVMSYVFISTLSSVVLNMRMLLPYLVDFRI